MSRSTKPSILKRLLKTAAFAAAGVLGLIYIQALAKLDPLSKLRASGEAAPQEKGIRLGDVHLVQYRGEKKVGEAMVDHVFITSDRRQYRMAGVRSGLYIPEDGKQVNFSAPQAVWNTSYGVLQASNGARLWNADLDLRTENFRINDKQQTVYVPGKISGRFYKGNIVANNFKYFLKDQSAQSGPMHWDGNLALNLQDDGTGARKKWEFDASGGTYSKKGDITTYTKTTANDGEIIIKADRVEHNTKTDVVTGTGHVMYFSPKANLTCNKVVIYRKEKRAILTESVDMLVKPKDKQTKAEIVEIPPFRPMVPKDIAAGRPDAPTTRDGQEKKLDEDLQSPKTIRNYPMAITAARIEYWYGKGNRHAIITGEPQARQELPGGRWRHLWAFQAFYDGEAETLKMDSREGKADTRYQSSLGDDVVAEEVIVSTKEDVDDLDAKGAKGKFYGTSDDDEAGPKPPDPIKPGTKGKGGGGLKGNIGGKKPPRPLGGTGQTQFFRVRSKGGDQVFYMLL